MKGLTPTTIEWCDYTWNVVTGCRNGCHYCYARRLADGRLKGRGRYVNGFEPTFHEDIVMAPFYRKQPSKIFISSMGEIWGHWVPTKWQDAILETVEKSDQHIFLNLTKNPDGLLHYFHKKCGERDGNWHFPRNLWLGVSIDTIDSLHRLRTLRAVPHYNLFVSFEPLHADVASHPDLDIRCIRWVIVGGETGPKPLRPNAEWVHSIEEAARALNIPVLIKKNAPWRLTSDRPQDFPGGFP